jgi:citrate lyase beta subunit
MTVDLRLDWLGVRSLFEAPILDDRKWAKIPTIGADAFILDMEDSVTAERKEGARARVVEYLGNASYFGSAFTVPRINHLDTPWGEADLTAVAQTSASMVMVPKVNGTDDVDRVVDILRSHGSEAKLLVCIETARGVMDIDRILSMEVIAAAAIGLLDLKVELRVSLFDAAGEVNQTLAHAQSRCSLAAAANRVAMLGGPIAHDIKSESEVRRRTADQRRVGLTGVTCFYPPHVPIIHDVFAPSDEDIAHARAIVQVYEEALAAGNAAVQLPSGEALLIHEYKEASRLLAEARERS